MIELSLDELRWIRLERQGLIEPFEDPMTALSRLVAVQTQYAMSLPVALAARTKRYPKAWDQKALASGEAVKSWSVRATLHVHDREHHGLALEGIGPLRRRRYAKWMREGYGLSESELEKLEEEMLIALQGGSLDRKTLHERVPALRNLTMTGWGSDVQGLAYLGRICVQTPEKGATRFQLFEPQATGLSETEALAELLPRYLAAYGPATKADYAYWLGSSQKLANEVFATLEDRLVEIKIEGAKDPAFDLAAPAPPKKPSGVRFLAKFDPVLLGWKDKSAFVAEKNYPRVYRKAGQIEAVVLSGGRLIGTWRLERQGTKAGRVVFDPFPGGKLSDGPATQAQLKRLARAIGLEKIELASG